MTCMGLFLSSGCYLFLLVWGFSCQAVVIGFCLYGAFPVKRLLLVFAHSSLFGAGKAVLRPVACEQVPGARGRGQATRLLERCKPDEAPNNTIDAALRLGL